MWWPARAPAPLLAEKGTQVRILGRTRCCIFPFYTMSLADYSNSVTASLHSAGGKATQGERWE